MARTAPPIPQGIYYLHNRIDKQTGKQQIYIRYYCRNVQIRRAMGIHVLAKDWNDGTQKISGSSMDTVQFNRFLQAFKTKVDGKLLEYKGEITPPVIKRVLCGEPAELKECGTVKNLVDYCYEYNKLRYDAGYCTYRTFENKESCIKVFEKFLKSIRKSKMTLSEIDVETIDKFIDYRKNELGNSSPEGINKSLVPIYKALEYASDNGLVERAAIALLCKHYIPTQKKSYDERNGEQIKFLNSEQINDLINYYNRCTRERTREFIEFWLFSFFACGLRISDVITLEWSHVDFENKTITKNQYKTGEDVSFPLNSNAIGILEKWKKKNKFKENRFVFRLLDDKFKLSDERGMLMRKNSLTKTINASLLVIGKKINVPFPLTMHVARHSFAVCAINNGMDLKILSKLMGHTTVTTTEKVYAKILLKTINKEYEDKTSFYNQFGTFVGK